MKIREASSVVVRRGGRVFLVRRSESLRFFGGYWAFPGGTVPPGAAGTVGAGGTSDRSGVESGDAPIRFIETAAREIFEELGIEAWAPTLGDRKEEARTALLAADARRDPEGRRAGNAVWSGIAEGRRIEVDLFVPLSKLLTPAYFPVRYDTRFFVLDLEEAARSLGRDPGAWEPEVRDGELVAGAWDSPEGWLERWARNEARIAPPVLFLLHALGKHADLGAVRAEIEPMDAQDRIHTIFHSPSGQLFPLRTETLPPATHTNAYLIGEDPAYLLDPGSADPDEQERLLDALDRSLPAGIVAERRVHAILLSHHHRDHLGAAARLRSERGWPIWAHPETARRLEGTLSIDREIGEGERLPLGRSPDGASGWELEVLHTPGHAPGHLCFFERRHGGLFVGDMVSTLSSVLIRPKDGTMSDYLRSLERLAALPCEVVYPAHGPASADGPQLIRLQIRHRAAREAAVVAALREGAGTIGVIVGRVYRDVPEEALPYAGQSVESILGKLLEEGRVVREGDGFRIA